MKPREIREHQIHVNQVGLQEQMIYLLELQRLAMEADYARLVSSDPEGVPDEKRFVQEWLQQCATDFRQWFETLIAADPDEMVALFLQARRGLQDGPALA